MRLEDSTHSTSAGHRYKGDVRGRQAHEEATRDGEGRPAWCSRRWDCAVGRRCCTGREPGGKGRENGFAGARDAMAVLHLFSVPFSVHHDLILTNDTHPPVACKPAAVAPSCSPSLPSHDARRQQCNAPPRLPGGLAAAAVHATTSSRPHERGSRRCMQRRSR